MLVFGPERLPEVARTMGRWFGEIGKSIQTARTQMEREFHESEMKTGGKAETTQMTDDVKSNDGNVSDEEKREE